MTNPTPKAGISPSAEPQLWQPPADIPPAPMHESAPFNPRQTMQPAMPAAPIAPTYPQAGPPAYAGHAAPLQPLPPRQPHAIPAPHYPQAQAKAQTQAQAHTHQHLATQAPYSPPAQGLQSRQGHFHNPHGTAPAVAPASHRPAPIMKQNFVPHVHSPALGPAVSPATGFAGPNNMPAHMPSLLPTQVPTQVPSGALTAPTDPKASKSLFKRLLSRKANPSQKAKTSQKAKPSQTRPAPANNEGDNPQRSSLTPFLAGIVTGLAVMFLGLRVLGGGEPEPAMMSPEPFAEAAPATGTFIENVVTDSASGSETAE